MNWVHAETPSGRVTVDPLIGNIRKLEFQVGGRSLSPLHNAPWADDADTLADKSLPPVEASLCGDFFCAPFGNTDVDDTPIHGWTANSRWRRLSCTQETLSFGLERRVMGAQVSKTLTLAGNAPLLYQTHEITGGEGQLTVAHHPMIRLSGSGTLSVSQKRAAITPDTALEAGRNRLALGHRADDISCFPAEGGGTVDLHHLPIADRHEDFVTLVEAADSDLGWTAIIRDTEDDIIFVLKNPDILPLTMLWHSNGGRDYSPWNGRHRGVLGIEDGCAAGAAGYLAALGPNPISDEGVPTALTLGRRIRIAHVIGAVPRPKGWARIQAITAENDQLTLSEAGGASLALPFDTDFLKKGS
ncbi:MAG: hypothetical protein R3186_09925 [Ruegeria sp.]|nr:hypothetical protein [Ruegeria sp.]